MVSSGSLDVVIIGGSFAGVHIAHALLKEVPSARVTLINPTPTFYFAIAAPRFLAKPHAFAPEQYLIPIARAFERYPSDRFDFVKGVVTSINVQAKTVTIHGAASIAFDYLVIASGSTTASTIANDGTPIPFKQSNHDNMKQLIADAQKTIASSRNIVIAGAGPIGVELAGEIAEAAQESDRPVSITLISAGERVLPMLKAAGSTAAERLLSGKQIKIRTSCRVNKAIPSKEAKTWDVVLDNGEVIKTDLYIPPTGVLPNNSFIPQEFLDESGWVKVDKQLRVQSTQARTLPIFAAGDITNNSMRLSFKAEEQAAVVAANIKSEILGHGKPRTYDQGTSVLMLVPVGASGGTGQLFGCTPWSSVVRLIKGKDFFISKAPSYVNPK